MEPFGREVTDRYFMELLDSEPDVRHPVTSGGLCLHLLLVTNSDWGTHGHSTGGKWR